MSDLPKSPMSTPEGREFLTAISKLAVNSRWGETSDPVKRAKQEADRKRQGRIMTEARMNKWRASKKAVQKPKSDK